MGAHILSHLSPRRQWRALALIAPPLIGLVSYFLAQPYFERSQFEDGARRLALYQNTLDQTLQRYRHLPFILSQDPLIIGALYGIGPSQTNTRLEAIARRSNIEALYLMNADGLTIAASNHADPMGFLGQNYGFRPYFTEAMRGQTSTFFAIGATTSRPGYFMAEGVKNAEGQVIGVMAVKIDLAPLVNAWRQTGETVFVSNADGVVFLSSDPGLRYRTLDVIDPFRRDEIATERQFAKEPLSLLDWRETARDRVLLNGAAYQHVTAGIGDRGWLLHRLAPFGQVRERAIFTAIGAMLAVGAVFAVALVLKSEQLRAALTSSETARRDLTAANEELRRAQAELKRTSKLAALGQLSASVTHELGQPISALKNYLAAAEIKAPDNPLIGPVGRILTRMEGITRQLRFFAGPAPQRFAPVALSVVIRDALALVAHDAERADISIRTALSDDVQTLGDPLRLEQVVVNLLRNAIAAMMGADAKRRVLDLSLTMAGCAATIAVADTGCGLAGRSLDDLAEPFHSTRESGEGMGLGLAISAEIIREHGGDMQAEEREGGGAIFTVTLPYLGTAHGPG